MGEADQSCPTTPSSVMQMAEEGRKDIKEMCIFVKEMMHECHAHAEGADIGETKANIMLAYRHLEDAAMRLGKVIQAQDGGKSVYDK